MGQESLIEKQVATYAIEKGCYVRKFSSPSCAGVPDRFFLTPAGVPFFIEFKRPGQKPTTLQAREIREINKRKGNAHWVDNIDDGKTIVDQYLKVKILYEV